jgi:hypothetical protein
MLKAIVPGYYLVHSRLKASWERVSWMLINPLVVGYIANRSANVRLTAFLVIYGLAFAAWISIYETGYLENDYCTIRRESEGSRRLSSEELATLGRSYWAIIAGKIRGAFVFITR